MKKFFKKEEKNAMHEARFCAYKSSYKKMDYKRGGYIYIYIYILARPKEKKNKYLGNRRGIQSEDNKSSR